jgi:tRNA(Ile)-lysidine synthase
MRAVVETGHLRILRPLLTVEPARLRTWLRTRSLTWIEDPSNADPAFARPRLRRASPLLAAVGITDAALDRLQARARAAADALDDAVTALLVRACQLDPAGWASLDRSALAGAPGEIAWRALARVLAVVGGRAWLPGRAEAGRMLARIGGATEADASGCLAGARVIAAGGRILVLRECRGLPAPMPIAPRDAFGWDARFVLSLRACLDPPPASLSIQALSAAGPRQVAALNRAQATTARPRRIPGPHLPTLPALFDGGEVVAVPHLGFTRPDWPADPLVAVYRPRRTLAGTGYFTGDCF